MARSWQQEEKLTVKEIETIMDIMLTVETNFKHKPYKVTVKTIVAKLGGMAYWLGKNGEL